MWANKNSASESKWLIVYRYGGLNDNALEIAVGDVAHVDDVVRFQVDMAMESEGLALEYERVRRGAQAVMDDEAKGRYIIARLDGNVVACLMITREWSD